VNEARIPTVVLADAHARYRGGLVRAVSRHPGLDLIGVADRGPVAVSMILSERPDLALLDARLPGLDGFAVCEYLSRDRPDLPTRLILLVAVLDRAQWARADSAGAYCCFGKELSRTAICEALLAAARGEEFVSDGGAGCSAS
jgi:two-component system nitrate/nitrite response regulator NarL